jgi:hypothetical protein
MWVSAKPINLDRRDIDDKARKIVLDAYHEGCRTRSHAPFDMALNNYRSQYPHISKELAGYAVAHILATAGM